MMDDLRAGVYEVLALGFCRPTPARLDALAGGSTPRLLSDLADLLPGYRLAKRGCFDEFCEDVRSRGAGPVAGELLIDYCRLLLGPGAVPCPPYGSLYLDGCSMGPSTLDVVGRYRGEGLKAAVSWKEPPDHIALELGFMARLSAACSRAGDANEVGEAERLLRLQGDFLRCHLGRWGPLFAEKLSQAASCHLYRFLSGLLPYWLSLDDELLRATVAGAEVSGCR